MAARTKKINQHPVDSATRTCCGGIGGHTRDCKGDDLEPVELDPPNPALARWEELLDRETNVYHGGDIEKVMSFPRPAWSDPDYDLFTSSSCALYRATPVRVVASRHSGDVSNPNVWVPAGVYVQPVIDGDRVNKVRISFSEKTDAGWKNGPYMALTVPEAEDLIDVLRAAVELIGGDK